MTGDDRLHDPISDIAVEAPGTDDRRGADGDDGEER